MREFLEGLRQRMQKLGRAPLRIPRASLLGPVRRSGRPGRHLAATPSSLVDHSLRLGLDRRHRSPRRSVCGRRPSRRRAFRQRPLKNRNQLSTVARPPSFCECQPLFHHASFAHRAAPPKHARGMKRRSRHRQRHQCGWVEPGSGSERSSTRFVRLRPPSFVRGR
jgi:hypothetical protein